MAKQKVKEYALDPIQILDRITFYAFCFRGQNLYNVNKTWAEKHEYSLCLEKKKKREHPHYLEMQRQRGI